LHMKNVQGLRSSAARAVPLARLRGEVLMCERYIVRDKGKIPASTSKARGKPDTADPRKEVHEKYLVCPS
jgi:hypothetical protein